LGKEYVSLAFYSLEKQTVRLNKNILPGKIAKRQNGLAAAESRSIGVSQKANVVALVVLPSANHRVTQTIIFRHPGGAFEPGPIFG